MLLALLGALGSTLLAELPLQVLGWAQLGVMVLAPFGVYALGRQTGYLPWFAMLACAALVAFLEVLTAAPTLGIALGWKLVADAIWLGGLAALTVQRRPAPEAPDGVEDRDPFASSVEIERCLLSCRRHSRPLGAVVVPTGRAPGARDPAVQRKLLKVIGASLRRTDLLAARKGGDLLVLCPDLGPEHRSVTLDRLETEVATNLGLSVHCGYASFPADALTLEELLRVALARSRHEARLPQPNRHRTPVLNSGD